MRIVVTGGGTGGHIYPALAVAERLQQDPQVEKLLYIGNRESLESQIIPDHQIAFACIYFYGMPRKPGIKWIHWLLDFNRAVQESTRLLKDFQPHVVFGTGGYVSAPVLMAAKNLKIPYMIHEPDAHPGLVNRLMSRWADKVTAAFIEAKNLLKGRSFHVTGNPIRGKIMEIIDGKLSKEAAKNQLGLSLEPDKKILLVTGGSQGARQINQAIIGAIPTLLDELHLQVIHQTGQKLFEDAMALLPAAYRDHPDYIMRPYFPDMSLTLASADFALCRSGSLTLSEMYLAGLPTILVPYPYAAADHQRKNAMASCKAGASRMIEDTQCTSEHVIAIVQELLNQSAAFEQMKTACTTLAHPYATDEIVGLLKSYGL